jgi:hypothetical protein
MDRSMLEEELKRIGVRLEGWVPVLQCETCKTRWEPFIASGGNSAPTARFDYWKCPNKCNASANVGMAVQRSMPRYLVLNGVPGMIFSDNDLPEFERYVRSMDATEIPNRN